MASQTFEDYLHTVYSSKKSNAANSYIQAIKIIEDLLKKTERFNLNGKSLAELRDPVLIAQIIDYVAEEEDKFRRAEESIFNLGKPTQKSYPNKRFCTAAIRRLGEFINRICCEEAVDEMHDMRSHNGSKLSSKLIDRLQINDKGSDIEVRAKRRIGQDIFRAMLLDIYDSKCCLTGLDVPEVLRASHIIPWSECVKTRLNPENGLCLSATYDAAFDKYLITFDEDYRLVLSPLLKEEYTSNAFKTYFLNFEGKAINLPTTYLPSQKFLEIHREKLIS